MTAASSAQSQPTSTARLAFAWVFVGVPLLYGVYETLLRAAKLFTG